MLHEWVAQLQQRFGSGKIAVALEQRKGAVIHALLTYKLLRALSDQSQGPGAVSEDIRPAGPKMTRSIPSCGWTSWSVTGTSCAPGCPTPSRVGRCRRSVNNAGTWSNERVALTNRLTSLLKRAFPQALAWVGDLASMQACDFLTRWPTLGAVQRARPRTIRKFYRAHNCRKADVIEARLAAIASARPLTTDAAVVEPLSLSVQASADAVALADRRQPDLRPPHRGGVCRAWRSRPLHELSRRRRCLCAAIGRRLWVRQFPMALRRRTAGALGHRTRHRTSGKTIWVHRRLACPKFVKQTFHEFADQSIRFCRWAHASYDQQRARGNNHHAALRALAYKWIRILFRCWKERRPYNEKTYIDALRQHGSPLAKHFA